MFDKKITAYNPGMQFFVFLLVLLIALIFTTIFQFILSNFGIDLIKMSKAENLPKETIGKLKLIKAAILFILLFIPAHIFANFAYTSPTKYLGLQSISKLKYWILAILFFACALPFSSMLEQWNGSFSFLQNFKAEDEHINKMYLAMLQGSEWKDLLINTIAICIAPAIIEEVFFRGCLQQLFANWLRKYQWVGVIVVAIIFSAFHGQISSFMPILFLGLILGIIYHFTSNLWITILLHFRNNFMTILMMFFFNAGMSKMNPLALGDVNSIVGILSGLATIGLGFYFYLQRKPFEIVEVEKDPNEIDLLFKN